MRFRNVYLGLVVLLVSLTLPVSAIEYQNDRKSLPAAKALVAPYARSIGSVVLRNENSTTGSLDTTRCVGSVLTPSWILLASHCAFAQSFAVKEARFVLSSEPDTPYVVDLAVLPKNRTQIKGDGTDRTSTSRDIVNDYALLRLQTPVPAAVPVTLCPGAYLPESAANNYLARAVYFGTNTTEYSRFDSILRPLLAGENIAYVTPNQVISDTTFGPADKFTQLWEGSGRKFNSSAESRFEQGNSGSPVFLRPLGCQIGVISYISTYRYRLDGEEAKIRADFAATLNADDQAWLEEVPALYSTLLRESIDLRQIPILEH